MSYQNPRNRLEVRLKEIIDNSAQLSDPRSRFELLLAAIVDEDLSPNDLRDRIELYLGQLGGRASGGGITPSGTLSIISNGIYDVETKKYADVQVPGIVPTGTLDITSNGSHDVTNYATVNVNVSGGSAVFTRSFTLTYRFTGSVDDQRVQYIYYRGPDPLNPHNVIWRRAGLFADGQQHTETIDLCPMLSLDPDDYENAIVDGFYIEGYDGGTTADVTVLSGDIACRYVEMSSGGQTGSEHYYLIASGASATIEIYLGN